jgi:hypothetical protein
MYRTIRLFTFFRHSHLAVLTKFLSNFGDTNYGDRLHNSQIIGTRRRPQCDLGNLVVMVTVTIIILEICAFAAGLDLVLSGEWK